jgi:hypothetical protein
MALPTSKITEEIPERFLEEESTVVVVLDQTGAIEFETPVKLQNPFEFDPQKFHPSAQAPTLERFIDLTSQIIADTQAREQTLESERVTMTDEYPMERFDRFGEEVITYRVISRKPANTSTDGKSRPQRGFGYSYHLRSPQYPDKVIIVESRPIDHFIEFSCWSKRARLANQRALWLERTLINSTWAYQVQGIDRFFWEERLADTYYNVGGQPLYQRPLRFFVRLSEFRPKAEPAISHISYETRVTNGPTLGGRSIL